MNVIPYSDFSKSKFLIQGELKEEVWYRLVEKFTIAALKIYQCFNGEIWLRSDGVRGRKDRRRYRQLSAICCIRRCLTLTQLLKLQSRTADEKNPWRQRRIWRGRSTTSPAQRSTTAAARHSIWVANRVHIHLKPTSMFGFNVFFFWGGGGGSWMTKQPKTVMHDHWSTVSDAFRSTWVCSFRSLHKGHLVTVLTFSRHYGPVACYCQLRVRKDARLAG